MTFFIQYQMIQYHELQHYMILYHDTVLYHMKQEYII